MNDAEKEKLLIKLNKIHEVIDKRILNLNDEIEIQIKLIQNNKNQLQSTTQDIVKNETESEAMRKQIDLINVELAKVESQINDLNNQITNNEMEIEDCNQQIKDQEPSGDIWEISFNPVAMFQEVFKALTNNIKECNDKIVNLRNEINKENLIKEENTIKKSDCEKLKLEIDNKIQQFQTQRIELEKLQSIKSQCVLLIESTNQGKDLLDIGINLVLEIEEKIKSLNLIL
ncbi:hypothetical protein ACTFIW_009480 [Dictyostelium discoideum]